MRTIRVTGTAQSKLRPDITVVTMTLQGTEPEYAAALSRASGEADSLREALAPLAFQKEDLKTQSFHVSAEYEGYEEAGVWKQRFSGYGFEHSLRLSFDSDDARLGAVLTALARGPLSPMLQLSYAVKDPELARQALLTRALADAREKAALLASASGAKLLALQSVDYAPQASCAAEPLHCLDAPASAKTRVEMHLEPDDVTLTETVTAVWEIAQENA